MVESAEARGGTANNIERRLAGEELDVMEHKERTLPNPSNRQRRRAPSRQEEDEAK